MDGNRVNIVKINYRLYWLLGLILYQQELTIKTLIILIFLERRRGPVVGHSLWTRPARVQSPWEARLIRCKNLALYIRDCESPCLSDETVKAVGPFYLVSMPGEVKDPTQGVNV